jgi:hypothetical protein
VGVGGSGSASVGVGSSSTSVGAGGSGSTSVGAGGSLGVGGSGAGGGLMGTSSSASSASASSSTGAGVGAGGSSSVSVGAGGSGVGGGPLGATSSTAATGSGSTGSGMSGSGGGSGVACQTASDCDDGMSCTADACTSNVCVHTPNNAACDNGAYCDGAELCDPVNGAQGTGCAASSGSPCDDGIACTVDACNEAADTCSMTANDALCDDGVACDGSEFCSALFGCLSTGPLSCDDGVTCTGDFCDVTSDSCKNVPQDSVCSDGQFCNGIEACDPAAGNAVTGCKPGAPINCNDGIPCTVDACDEAADACAYAPNNAACDDGVFCDGQETCTPGVGCEPSAPVACDDGLSCTQDSCSEALASCVFTPNNAVCSDGLDCNGQETCVLQGGAAGTGCKDGAPIPCGSDGIACTVDACNEATNACEHTPSSGLCQAGQFCVPQQGGCTAAMPCSNNAQCDDGNKCNGVETCNVVCKPGTPVNCNDGIECTIDACAPATGACSHATNNAYCSDGYVCNGIETCSAQSGCVSGLIIDCDDGVECTFDQCVEPSGGCAHYLQDDICDDGAFCNGSEVCTLDGCASGAPVVCNDGIACTTDTCDPVIDGCTSAANSDVCPCGQTCLPAQGGCTAACNVTTCQGKVYQCGDCLDNDGDCRVDVGADSMCLGPCDNTEDSFYGGIPGQNNSPCKSDCYFDQDTGSGNDDCYWSHKCDPLEVAPLYPPEGSQCAYNPNSNIPGTQLSCSQANLMQSQACGGYCGPLTPNGCDCFGCCAIPGAPKPVWLGSENPAGVGSCSLSTLNDPTKCKPCTQVSACLNTCEICEICVGKPTLPPGCGTQTCPPGVQPCGLGGQALCPEGSFCNTGCCVPNPE